MTDQSRHPGPSPLVTFLRGALAARAPSPLAATRIDVEIDAGLAVATTTRVFRNAEEAPIEATLTFPVPVHATLFGLTARIGDRRLAARAQPRKLARETYEDAVERGKTAVLHEELLKGVHLLTVGQIPPGAEVEVSAVYAQPLTATGGAARLRLPLTVGDVYGPSPLGEAEALIHGGENASALLTVRASEGGVALDGAPIDASEDAAAIEIPLNRPIDLSVSKWTPREIVGRASDGRAVALSLAPRESEDRALDVALLIDRSGSMSGRYDLGVDVTKHQSVVGGMMRLAGRLMAGDKVDLWQFDDHAERTAPDEQEDAADADEIDVFIRRAARLGEPRGGTEIGGALEKLLRESAARDVLLITDGMSYALDVQGVARAGKRVSVLLVGKDSLEAKVGWLASVTGGEIFIAAGPLEDALFAAIESLRSEVEPRPSVSGAPESLSRIQSGMRISAAWRPDGAAREDVFGRAAAAVAAALALPAMPEDAATELAVAEGLTTHLTSLVLVDEESEPQEGEPVRRKVALPTPQTLDFMEQEAVAVWAAPLMAKAARSASMTRVAFRRFGGPAASAPPEDAQLSVARKRIGDIERKASQKLGNPSRARRLRSFLENDASSAEARSDDRAGVAPLTPLAVDWAAEPDRLRRGDVAALAPEAAAAVRRLATLPTVALAARRHGLDPIVLALALYALAAAAADPGAAAFAEAALGERPAADVEALFLRLTQ